MKNILLFSESLGLNRLYMETVSHSTWHTVVSPVNVNSSLAARNRGRVSSVTAITSIPYPSSCLQDTRDLDIELSIFAEYMLISPG